MSKSDAMSRSLVSIANHRITDTLRHVERPAPSIGGFRGCRSSLRVAGARNLHRRRPPARPAAHVQR